MPDRERKGRSLVHGLKPHKKKKKMKKADEGFLIVGDDYWKPKKKNRCLTVAYDLVVFQILSRLPVKTLMRFKSVCKSWKSIIVQDSHFMNLHYTHSKARPGLFMVQDKRIYIQNSRKLSLLSVDLNCDSSGVIRAANLQSVKTILQPCLSSKTVNFLGPVRGLICFVDRFAVQICNVSTGEVTPWITSSLVLNTMNRERRRKLRNKCYFGFDPTSGNFKVMFMWLRSPPVCEVLTVGGDDDARFRIIDSVPPPPSCIPDIDVVVGNDGSVVYWFSYHREELVENRIQHEVKYSESLIAFDFGSEQFRIIPVPEFNTSFRPMTQLIEMDGCPTVVRHKFGITSMITMWKFHGSSSSSSCSEEDWTKVEIRAPSHIEIKYLLTFFHSIPGKDLMILEAYDLIRDEEGSEYFMRNVKFARLYFYDLKNKSFRKFKIEGISFLGNCWSTLCTPLVESLFPVEKKLVS
ncbi:Putative F-box protein At4g38870 [Linum perenne]